MTIILASQSPVRRRLLAQTGIDFETAVSGTDEASVKASLLAEGASPREIAEVLAELKAVSVSRRTMGAFVIGADQVLELEGTLYDKPGDLAGARQHLETLRGKTHRLHTAAVVAKAGAPIWRQLDAADLTMRTFSDAFLDAYLEAEGEAVTGSVGAYFYEGRGAQLFSRVSGDYFTVLGLPLLPLLQFMRDHGVLAP